jgi:hypothetical protein
MKYGKMIRKIEIGEKKNYQEVKTEEMKFMLVIE